MATPTRSLLWAALLLLLAEVLLRALPAPGPAAVLPADRPVVLLHGSSRTVRGLRPTDVAATLAGSGVPGVEVFNAGRMGRTTLGLYQLFRDELAPLLAAPRRAPGVLAIEVRGSGLNDSFVPAAEHDDLQRRPLPSLDAEETADASSPGWLTALRDGRPADASSALLGELHVARGASTLRPVLEEALEEVGRRLGWGTATGERADWTAGERGFLPFAHDSAPDLRWNLMREHYQGHHLADFALGGVQTQALRLLVREVRALGWRPLLYVLPLTPQHRSFFGPGEYEAFKAHLAAVAVDEDAPLLDLDARLPLPRECFYDTHHLNAAGAAHASRALAEQGLLPLLREPSAPRDH